MIFLGQSCKRTCLGAWWFKCHANFLPLCIPNLPYVSSKPLLTKALLQSAARPRNIFLHIGSRGRNSVRCYAATRREAIARIYETSGRLLNLGSWHKHLRCLTNTAATNALRISGICLAHLLMVNEEKWAQFINAPTEMQSVFRDPSASADASIFDSSYGGPLRSNDCSSLANIPAWARRMPSRSGQENEPL